MWYEGKTKKTKSETVIDHFKEESKILLKMKPQNVNKREIKIIYKTQHFYFVNSDTRYAGQRIRIIFQYLRKKQTSNAKSTQPWFAVVHKNLTNPPNIYTTQKTELNAQ